MLLHAPTWQAAPCVDRCQTSSRVDKDSDKACRGVISLLRGLLCTVHIVLTGIFTLSLIIIFRGPALDPFMNIQRLFGFLRDKG